MTEPPEPPPLRRLARPAPTGVSFARVLLHRPGRLDAATTVTPHGVQLNAWRPSPASLQAYRDVVGSRARLPLTFPALVTVALFRDLIGQGGLPVSGLGLVHVASEIATVNRLPADAPWRVTAWVQSARHTSSGLELDLWSRCEAGDASWTVRMVTLSRSSAAAGPAASAAPALPEPDADWGVETTLVAGEGIGRAYARVSGDLNPIHLHAWAARPFGFARAIAHGWWTLPRALAVLGVDETPEQGRRHLEVSYRRPVILPSRVRLLGAMRGSATTFLALRDQKPLFGGRLRAPLGSMGSAGAAGSSV